MLIVSVPLRTSSQHTTNSSPPNRATVSDGPHRRPAAGPRPRRGSRRRAACPSESLTSLKWSRSRNSSATLESSTALGAAERVAEPVARAASGSGRPVERVVQRLVQQLLRVLALLGDVDRVRHERDDRARRGRASRSRGAGRARGCRRVARAGARRRAPALSPAISERSRRCRLTRSSGCTASTKPARSTCSRPSSSRIAGFTATISPTGSWIAMPTGACSNASRNGSTLDRRDRARAAAAGVDSLLGPCPSSARPPSATGRGDARTPRGHGHDARFARARTRREPACGARRARGSRAKRDGSVRS